MTSCNNNFYSGIPYVKVNPYLTLADLTGDDLLDGQIIVQLRNTVCLHGIDAATLLARLEATYPDTVWDEATLNSRLALGRRFGRFCLNALGAWVIRNDMVAINFPQNAKFQGLSSKITKAQVCSTTVTTPYGAYEGHLPCCHQNN